MVSTRSATASSPRRPRSSLSASHAILYPVTHALGVRGTKKDKRRQINQMWRENLEIHSPYPHFSARLPSNHRGHDLTGPILNTNKNAGGYRQVVRVYLCLNDSLLIHFTAGCLPANRKGKRGGKTAVFCIRAGLPLHTLQSGMLGRLARARAELQPVSRAAAWAARAAGATTNTSPSSSVTASTLPPSSSPSISASSRATTPDASISTLSHDNAPDAPIVSHAAGAAIDTEHATAPSTPRHRGLTGFFGGYGGVHYSPEGYIINHSADHDDAMQASNSHPRTTIWRTLLIQTIDVEDIDTRTLDLTTPVYLIAWDDALFRPIRILAHPRINEADSDPFRIGEVVLQDYEAEFVARGFAVRSHIQRYLSPGKGLWITAPWSTYSIPIHGLNRVIYLRNEGVNVTPPGHVLELYEQN
ncbi:hypothetical protein DFH08DRAFT_825946 [Mycena albidolilacea]|uniref:Uncharacterized protein n=1 Tax=Mycena albidolilacea TaxID=1033008 RepID=A0AAD6Z0V9_9AGAR|nr:hypothetical protein DFH08DRAFT_825946 [Mycena albidolilacea]